MLSVDEGNESQQMNRATTSEATAPTTDNNACAMVRRWDSPKSCVGEPPDEEEDIIIIIMLLGFAMRTLVVGVAVTFM